MCDNGKCEFVFVRVSQLLVKPRFLFNNFYNNLRPHLSEWPVEPLERSSEPFAECSLADIRIQHLSPLKELLRLRERQT